MKQLLRYTLIVLLALCGRTATAADVLFDFDNNASALFPTIPGRSSGSNDTYVADGEIQSDVTATVDGVSLTVSATPKNAEGGYDSGVTPNRLWKTSPVLRLYNGTLTVKAADGHKITAMAFKVASNKWKAENTCDNGTVAVDAANTTNVNWTGAPTDKVVFTIAGNTQIKSLTVTIDGEEGGTVTPPVPESQYIFEQSFTESLGAFTIENNVLPEGFTYIWNWGGATFGAKASAYNKAAFAADARLISPDINLAGCSNITLAFDHAVNKGTPTGLTVEIYADGAYHPLNVTPWPAGKDWNFVSIEKASLDEYAGKTIRIAFHYTSTTDNCPTWEIKNLIVDGSQDPAGINNVNGKSQVKGQLYNLAGQQITSPKGIYIQNGKKYIGK